MDNLAAAQELRRIGRQLEKDIKLSIETWQIATGFMVEEVTVIPGDSPNQVDVSVLFNLGAIDDDDPAGTNWAETVGEE